MTITLKKGYELIIEGTAGMMAVPIGTDGKDFLNKLSSGSNILIVYGGLRKIKAIYGPLNEEHLYPPKS